jgi:hypothetical protein
MAAIFKLHGSGSGNGNAASAARRCIGALVLAAAVVGTAALPASASSATRLPCTYEARVAGCHIRPHRFYLTRHSWFKALHWSRWNHTSASGAGLIGGADGDGAGLVLGRVRDHHFTRLTVITQGIYEHFHWSASAHRWES